MKRISVHRLYKDRHNMPKDTLFWLYDNHLKPTEVALAIKINDRFYNSVWIRENAKNWKEKLLYAMKQIAIIQKTGWAKVQETEDEFGYPVTLFRCAYCNREAINPVKECSCRKSLAKFSLSPETALMPTVYKATSDIIVS